MKIKHLFFIVLTTASFAQQKGLVNYGYIYSPAEGSALGLDYNAYLVFNKEQSYYVTTKDSLENAASVNTPKTNTDNEKRTVALYSGKAVSKMGDLVSYDIKKDSMCAYFVAGDIRFYLKEAAPKMNWKIQNETKKIGNFICKKATTSFRGRDYTAWFTPEITVPFGPWKLNGLPGLILEAYDEGKFVYWYFKNAEYPSKTKEKVQNIIVPKETRSITYNEYKREQIKAQEKEKENNIILNQQFKDQGIVLIETPLSKNYIEFE